MVRVFLAWVLAMGCAARSHPAPRERGSGDGGGARDAAACDPAQLADRDGDGVPDEDDGAADHDGDGIADVDDVDDDGDGLLTTAEVQDADLCTPPADADADGVPNHLDLDSDDDDLSDADEVARGTDPTDEDTDDDGFPDGMEVAVGTNPRNEKSIPDVKASRNLPFEAPDPYRMHLVFGTHVERADVAFLVDTTAGSGATVDALQDAFDDVASGISGEVDDAHFCVAAIQDFARAPYGETCGEVEDQPFRLLQPCTDDVGPAQDAIDLLDQPLGCGGDAPDATVEALYQAATGEGIARVGDAAHPYAAAAHCEAAPGEPEPVGTMCFRPDAQPILVVLGNAEMHAGPPDGTYAAYDVPDAEPSPHGYPEALDVLGEIGARVVGLSASDAPGLALQHLCAAASDTGTATSELGPLCFAHDATAAGLGDAIVEAVSAVATEVPLDVTGRCVNETLGVDACRFVKGIFAIAADPPDDVAGMDAHGFFGVPPGTRVELAFEMHNDFVPPEDRLQLFRIRLELVASGTALLDERDLFLVVPSLSGEGL